MYKILLRYNLLLLLGSVLFLPLLLIFITLFLGEDILPKSLAADYKLVGYLEKSAKITQRPKFTLDSVTSHAIQQYYEKLFSNTFPLRSFFIRLNNQIYYSLFKKSYAEYGTVIVGKSNQLITDHYINTYCNSNNFSKEKLQSWANNIKTLSDFFQKQNKVFLYVISPSKAEYSPQYIPDRFHCKVKGENLYLTEMVKFLEERKINYINGPKLMEQATKQYGTSMFPRGGIHWNKLGATVATQSILEGIKKGGLYGELPPLSFNYKILHKAKEGDKDLLKLLNLLYPDANYEIPMVKFKNITSSSPSLSLAIIGGSFCAGFMDVLMENKIFSKISFYSYFKLSVLNFEEDTLVSEIANPSLTSKEILSPILSANVVILEENSSLIASNHGQLFFDTLTSFVPSLIATNKNEY